MVAFDRHSRMLSGLLALFFVASGPVACGDSEETETDDDPELVLAPETLKFSADLDTGDSVENELVVTNAGGGDLQVSELAFGDDTDEAFEKGTGWFDDEIVLEQEESHELSVVFEMPEQGTLFEGSISLETNDPDRPHEEIEIIASEPVDDPRLHVMPQTVVFPASADPGEPAEESVVIENTGGETLEVWDVAFGDNPEDVFEKGQDWPDDELYLDPGESHDFSVVFDRSDITEQYVGTLQMESNDPKADSPTEIELDSGPPPTPELVVDSDTINFPYTEPGEFDEEIVTIQNIGTAPLEIDDISVTEGAQDYSITFFDALAGDGSYPDRSLDTDDPPETVVAGDQVYVRVRFTPDSDNASQGEVLIESNDPFQEHFVIALMGNTGVPCLDVVGGQEFDFGLGSIHEPNDRTLILRNCAPQTPTVITDIGISDDGGGVFSLSEDNPGDDLPEGELTLEPHEVQIIILRYTPEEALSHSGVLDVSSTDATRPHKEISLDGEGIDADCPIAEAAGSVDGSSPENPVSVDPPDVVELTGDGSYSPRGDELDYEWSLLSSPSNSLAYIESPQEADTSINIDIAGHFVLSLHVYDESGLASCEPAFVDINP